MARKKDNTEYGSPFLYVTVEDIVKVKSTRFWKNNNVRVLSKVYYCKIDENEILTLESPLKSRNDVKIILNMEVLNCNLPQGRMLEIFGYLDVLPLQDPTITVLFYRHVCGVSITSYYKAICLRNRYIPQFNDEDDEMPLSPAQFSCETGKMPFSPQVEDASPSQE